MSKTNETKLPVAQAHAPSKAESALDSQTLDPSEYAWLCAKFDELDELPSAQIDAVLSRLSNEYPNHIVARLRKMLLDDARNSALENSAQLARNALLLSWSEHEAKLMSDASLGAMHATIGAWTLLRELGHGGMGVVYLAQRELPGFKQQGALKLLHLSKAGADAKRRFAREQKVLSQLEHPGIARLLDAGVIGTQQYLVMEYVEGVCVLDAVRGARMPLKARLQLFLQLCAAVAFAHQQLIIHRDIKPGNVMLDHYGRIKLLDFGIAKILDHTLEPDATNANPLTPLYAAPEQRRNQPTDVRTDVYGLGLVLFELLTEQRALQADPDTGPHAMLNPVAPSVRVARASPLARSSSVITAAQLRGDLDVIVMKAIAQEPPARYRSVESLSDDIERYLAGLTIRAKPPGRWQIAAKFVARHRAAVGVLSLAVAGLMVLTAVALQQAHRAELARLAAERAATTSNVVRAHFVGVLISALEEPAALNPEKLIRLASDISQTERAEGKLSVDSRRAILLAVIPALGMQRDVAKMREHLSELEPLMSGANAKEQAEFAQAKSLVSESSISISGTTDTTSTALLMSKAVALFRANRIIEAKAVALHARARAKTDPDVAYRLIVETVTAQILSKSGDPLAAVTEARALLAAYQQQGVGVGAPQVQKTWELLIFSHALLGDIASAQQALDALSALQQQSQDAARPDQASMAILQLQVALNVVGSAAHATIAQASALLSDACGASDALACENAAYWQTLALLRLGDAAAARRAVLTVAKDDSRLHALLGAMVHAELEPDLAPSLLKLDVKPLDPYSALRELFVFAQIASSRGWPNSEEQLRHHAIQQFSELALPPNSVYRPWLAR